jgi:hypothetical protein
MEVIGDIDNNYVRAKMRNGSLKEGFKGGMVRIEGAHISHMKFSMDSMFSYLLALGQDLL